MVACRQREAADGVGIAQLLERLHALFGQHAADQRQVPAHVDNGVDMLDQHRARLNAGAAGRAGPQRLRLDQPRHQGSVGRPGMKTSRNAWARASCIGSVGLPAHARHQVLDQLLRIQRLAGCECRAGRLALAALHTGIERQQAVPGEVVRLAGAQRTGVEVERCQRGGAEVEAHQRSGALWVLEALRPRMQPQVQQAGHSMLHGAAPADAERKFGRPGREGQRDRRGQERRESDARQRHAADHHQRHGKQQQRVGQAPPVPARQACRRCTAAPCHRQCTAQHRQAGDQQDDLKRPHAQAQPVVERHDDQAEYRATGHRHMGARHEGFACNHMVQIDQVALGNGQQAEPVDRCRAPLAPEERAAQQAERESQHGRPEDEADELRQGKRVHRGQKSLHRRSAS